MSKYKDVLKYIQLYTGCTEHALKRIDAMLHEQIKDGPAKVVEKFVYVDKLARSKDKPSQDLKFWAFGYLKLRKLSYEQIADKSRKTSVLRLRNDFCIAAYKEGYTLSEIGRYLGRDHSTIYHCIYRIKTK